MIFRGPISNFGRRANGDRFGINGDFVGWSTVLRLGATSVEAAREILPEITTHIPEQQVDSPGFQTALCPKNPFAHLVESEPHHRRWCVALGRRFPVGRSRVGPG